MRQVSSIFRTERERKVTRGPGKGTPILPIASRQKFPMTALQHCHPFFNWHPKTRSDPLPNTDDERGNNEKKEAEKWREYEREGGRENRGINRSQATFPLNFQLTYLFPTCTLCKKICSPKFRRMSTLFYIF